MTGVVGQIVDTREHLERVQALASSLCVARVWRATGHSSTVGDVEMLEQQAEAEIIALATHLNLPLVRQSATHQHGEAAQ